MKKIKSAACAAIILIMAAGLFTPAMGAAPAKQGGKPQMDKKAQDFLKSMQEVLKHRFTPVIKKVTVGAAKAGSPISVSVQAGYDDKRAIDKISEVRVYYSANGGKQWAAPVKLSLSGAEWKGAIPAQKAKGTLTYYIWIKDNRGNVAAELPCKVSTWPPSNDACMVKGAVDPEPVDDPVSAIENNLDIWDVKVGMDDKYVYIQQSVEGNINKGTLSPTHINFYISLAADANTLKELDDLMSLFANPEAAKKKFKGKENTIWAMIYSPLAKNVQPNMKECFTPRMDKMAAAGDKNKSQPQMPEMDSTNVSCSAKGPSLFFRLNKGVLPAAMKSSLVVLGGWTLSFAGEQNIKMGDMANFTRLIYNPRTLKIN